MDELTFEWDEAKAASNQRKHRVNFEEAKTIFDDPFLQTFPDPDHSTDEERFINLGTSTYGRILVVVHIERDATIRLISARPATPRERLAYEAGETD